MIELSDVSVQLGSATVLDDVSLSIDRGDWLGLIGPNGAGKSTALRAICGLVATSGSITVDGLDVARDRRQLARLVAYVPQEPLIPDDMRVADYAMLGRTPHLGYLGIERPEDHAAVGQTLERLDLAALAQRRLGTLSGGERQRAVLARAIAQAAPVLLLDEPTSALDVGHQQQALELVARMQVDLGLTVIAAMHDLTFASQYAGRVALLTDGRVRAVGTPHAVLTADTIAAHYGASVHVLEAGAGVAVIPRRPDSVAQGAHR